MSPLALAPPATRKIDQTSWTKSKTSTAANEPREMRLGKRLNAANAMQNKPESVAIHNWTCSSGSVIVEHHQRLEVAAASGKHGDQLATWTKGGNWFSRLTVGPNSLSVTQICYLIR